MFKKIIKIFLVFILFFGVKVYSDFVVCDSGNINYNGKTVSEICNGGYESLDIRDIEFFTGSYVDMDLGFWGTDNNLDSRNNISENFPVGFFDTNKKTVTENVNPEFFTPVGFIGTTYSNSRIVFDLENNYPVGFFDINKKTVILKTNLDYSFPVGYLGNHILKKNIGRVEIPVIQNISYRDFFEEIFKKSTNLAFINLRYSEYEYNIFINNLLDLLIDGNKDEIIPEETKNRINLYIEDSSLNGNLNILMNNLKDINLNFKNNENIKIKFYILEYYLNKD